MRELTHGNKAERRAQRVRDLSAMILALPEKKYGVVLEDYEWDHETWSERGKDRHASNHYSTSADAHTAEEIVARTKERFDCAADDCVLFMWVTSPFLDVAMDVLRLRCFTYKTTIMWDKVVDGTGYWFRNCHEQMLISTRGNVPAPAPGTQWSSVIVERKRGHSVKPEQSYQMIEQYFPNVPKIELNCRGKPRPAGMRGATKSRRRPNEANPSPAPAAETFDLRSWNQPFTVTVGFYADGAPGEVFIESGKTGNDIDSIARDAGVLLSLALQHGVPPETIRHAVTRGASEEPASILGAVVDCISTNSLPQRRHLMSVDRDEFSGDDPNSFNARPRQRICAPATSRRRMRQPMARATATAPRMSTANSQRARKILQASRARRPHRSARTGPLSTSTSTRCFIRTS